MRILFDVVLLTAIILCFLSGNYYTEMEDALMAFVCLLGIITCVVNLILSHVHQR